MSAATVPANTARSVEAPVRGVNLWGGLSANLLGMTGIGPFITIPVVLATMGGPQALLGWVLGAILCLFDGLVWAELGSALPESGGPYHYLRQAFGPLRLGRMFGFVFLWQSLLMGPLNVAAAAVGVGQYATYLAPHLQGATQTLFMVMICLINTLLLYRPIGSVQRLSMLIGVVVIGACLWIVVSGVFRFDAKLAFDFPPGAFKLTHGFWTGLGAATLLGVYDYGGYNTVCMVGGEIERPRRTIPLTILISIPLVAALYIGMNLAILGALPWRRAAASQAVAADFMQAVYGRWGGLCAAVLILVVGWGGALVNLLGYSRVPYAAAAEGDFFKVFAKLHPKGGFPTVSLLFMGLASAVACLISLQDLFNAIIVTQAMFQFIAQAVAVAMLRRQKRPQANVFRMPLYPLPLIITIAGWLYIVFTAPPAQIAISAGVLLSGAGVFLAIALRRSTWPFVAALRRESL